MGSCTRRHFLLSICILQLLTIIERQVFDFLGYMWAPILSNFFHIIFVIFGFFGAYQFRAKYIVTYSIWNVLWIGWNLFLICFYLSIGILDKNSDILNLGTGSVSWFEINGYGCKPIFPTNITSEDPFRPVRPDRVENCILDYTRIEIIHAAFQILLSVLGLLGAILIARIFFDEDDRFDFMGGDAKCPQHTVVHPMYVSYSSIPTSSATNTVISPKKLFTNNNTNSLRDITKPNNNSNTNSLSSFYNNTNNNHKLNRTDDRRHSNLSVPLNNRLGDIHYTELSTEKLFSNNNNYDNDIILDDDDVINNNNNKNDVDKIRLNYNSNFNIVNKLNSGSGEVLRKNNNDLESYSLKNLKTFNNNNNNNVNPDINSTNYGYIPQPYPNVSNKIKSNYRILENVEQSNTHDNPEYLDSLQRSSVKNNTLQSSNSKHLSQQQQQQQQHPHQLNKFTDQQMYSNPIDSEMIMNNNEESDKYVIPSYQYNVTRSPNLNRMSSKRREYNHQQNSQERSQFVNKFYDQIRDAPPGYIENIAMYRARSQDRLSQRRHHQNINNINSPTNNNNNNNVNNNQHYYNSNKNIRNQNKIRPRSYCSNGSYPEHL